MKEIRSGPHRTTEGSGLPVDARKLETSGSYQVYISRQAASVIIVGSDYHPGPLQLDQRDLDRLAAELRAEMAKAG